MGKGPLLRDGLNDDARRRADDEGGESCAVMIVKHDDESMMTSKYNVRAAVRCRDGRASQATMKRITERGVQVDILQHEAAPKGRRAASTKHTTCHELWPWNKSNHHQFNAVTIIIHGFIPLPPSLAPLSPLPAHLSAHLSAL